MIYIARVYKRHTRYEKVYDRKTKNKHGREFVKPIKKEDFDTMIRLCLVKRDKYKEGSQRYRTWYRNYILLILGVNTGNRIEVLVELTPRDIAGGEYTVVEFKTGKTQQFTMNPEVYKVVKKFIDKYKIGLNEFIFTTQHDKNAAMTREMAWKVIKSLANDAGIEYIVACHSLRKSYGRWEWDRTKDLLYVQQLLMHSSAEHTMRYICLEANDVHEARRQIQNIPRYE